LFNMRADLAKAVSDQVGALNGATGVLARPVGSGPGEDARLSTGNAS